MAESLINDLAQLGDRQKCFVIALFAGIYKDGMIASWILYRLIVNKLNCIGIKKFSDLLDIER